MSGAYGSAELLDPVLRNAPAEWADALLDAHGRPLDPAALLPDPVTRLHTRAQMDAREALARRRWFIVRNVTQARSRGTGRVETYFTVEGLECPYRYPASISAMIRQRIDPDATSLQQVEAVFGHMLAIGAIEPITRARAETLALAIYAKTRGRVDVLAAGS